MDDASEFVTVGEAHNCVVARGHGAINGEVLQLALYVDELHALKGLPRTASGM